MLVYLQGKKDPVRVRMAAPPPGLYRTEEAFVRSLKGAGPDENRAVRERLGTVFNLTQEYLPFGLSEFELPEQFQSWTLVIERFNGQRDVLFPGKSEGLDVRVFTDTRNERLLRIHVTMPKR